MTYVGRAWDMRLYLDLNNKVPKTMDHKMKPGHEVVTKPVHKVVTKPGRQRS